MTLTRALEQAKDGTVLTLEGRRDATIIIPYGKGDFGLCHEGIKFKELVALRARWPTRFAKGEK